MKLNARSILRDMRIADFNFSNYVSILKQNGRVILIVSMACCVASFLGAGILLEDLYRSEAEIRVLYGSSSPIGSRSSDHSVRLVRERMTRDSLESVIVDNSLYPQQRQPGSLAEALKAIERDISTSGVREDGVRLAFQASDPALAQKVARQLVARYEDGVGQALTQEDQMMRGLSDEIKKAEADLARQEERVKDFNLRFLGGHLEKQTATLAALNRLILQLQSNADLLNALQEQKLSQEKFLTQQERRPASELSGGPLDSKVQPANSSIQTNPSSLTYSEMRGKIDQFNNEIEQRKGQQTKIRKEMALYQARIDSAPKVRALQSAIVRDYESANRHYQDLLAKKNEAEMAKAAKKISEPSFQVLSPASFPDTPSNNRFMARLSGLLWGPLVAIGIVLLRSSRAEQRVSLEQVISQSGVPVLASIPWIPLGTVRPDGSVTEKKSHPSSTQTT